LSVPANGLLDVVSLLTVFAGPLPAGLAIARRSLPDACRYRLTFKASAVLTTWCGLQSGIAVALGSTGVLRLQPLLFAEAFVAVAGMVFLLRGAKSSPASTPFQAPTPLSPPEAIIGTLLTLTGVFLIWQIVTVPVTEYDSLMYHLPATAGFYRTGSLQVPDQFRDNQIGYYPYSWEAIGTLLILPLREDVFVLLPNLVSAALLGIFIFLLAAEAGADRATALAVAAVSLTYPITIRTVGSAHVDLPLATFFLAAIYYGKVYARTANPWNLFLSSASVGTMLGIKTSGVIYSVLTIFALVWFLLAARRADSSPASATRKRTDAVSAAVAVGVGLIVSGWWFWYARNWIVVGNPLGLVPVRVAGITILPGPLDVAQVRKTTLAHLFDLSNPSHVRILARVAGRELGLPFIVLAFAVPLSVLRMCLRPTSINRDTIFFVGLAAATVLVYWFTPYGADNGSNGWQISPWIGGAIRYAFPFLGALAVLVAVLGVAVPLPASLLVALLLVNCSLFLSYETEFLYLYGLCLAGCGILAGVARSVSPGSRFGWVFAAVGAAAFAGILLAIPIIRTKREAQRVDKYGGLVRFIDENTQPGQPVGYVCSHKGYLFYGAHLDREAVYCPPDDSQSLSAWVKSLRQRGISLIAAGPVVFGLEGERELPWIVEHRDLFVPVFGTDLRTQVVVYQLGDVAIGQGK
jgi:hypothetical protein